MPNPHPLSPLRAFAALCALAGVLASPTAAIGQWLPVLSDVRPTLPSGTLSVTLSTHWLRYDSRTGFNGESGVRLPLGHPYSGPLGVSHFPALRTTEQGIQELIGSTGHSLSLGEASLSADVRRTVTPLAAELAVRTGLSVGFVLPLVRSAGELALDMNARGGDGSVGWNPAAEFQGARVTNVAVRDQITASAGELESRLAECSSNPGAVGCTNLLPRTSEAEALLIQSRTFRDQLERVFGSDSVAPRAFAPREGAAAYLFVDGQLTAFSNLYRDLLGLPESAPHPIAARPVGAQTPLTATQLRRYLEQPEYGIGMSLAGFERQGVGDIELFIRASLFNSGESAASGRGSSASITVRGRLPTGVVPSPDIPFETGTGDGQTDVEVGAQSLLALSRRLTLAAAARYGLQLPANVITRIAAPGTPFPELFTLREVGRDLGDYLDVGVQPRVHITDHVALLGSFHFMTKGADSYTGEFLVTGAETGRESVTLNANVLDSGSAATVMRGGVGLTVSNHGGRGGAVTRLPLDFSFSYDFPVSASGAGVPHGGLLSISIGYQTGLPGSRR